MIQNAVNKGEENETSIRTCYCTVFSENTI